MCGNLRVRGGFLICSLTAILLGYGSGYAEETLPSLPALDCSVTAIHGYFPTYSPLPVAGSTVQINIGHLTEARGVLDFVPKQHREKKMVSVIPYSEPFKVVSAERSPDGQLIRLLSASGQNQSLTLDFRYFYKAHQKSYVSLLYEVPIVAGICFLECVVNPSNSSGLR